MTHPAPNSESDVHTKPAGTEQVAGAGEILALLANDLGRYNPWGGTRSQRDADAIRLILSAYDRQAEEIEWLRGELAEAADTMVKAGKALAKGRDL